MSSIITGSLEFNSQKVPVVSTVWSITDQLDTLKVRWAIGRMHYKVDPGLYAVGSPDASSEVFVTGNYKLSVDHLRRALNGLNAWMLVLDTKGINVWCAAGKKTFSTKELVKRIGLHELDRIVTHRRLILPQLGATGVSAHQVKDQTGFRVIYGPVRAKDIPAFLEAGLKAVPEMRTVNFPLVERLKVIPVDIFYGKYYLLLVPSLFFILSGLTRHGYSIDTALNEGWRAVVNLYAGYLSGCALAPALLPWIPFRRFSLKGMIMGLVSALLLYFAGMLGTNWLEPASWVMMMAGLSSFMTMNFTGSSTFTSLSGVQKEMKTALPLQIAVTVIGLIGWIVSRFITP